MKYDTANSANARQRLTLTGVEFTFGSLLVYFLRYEWMPKSIAGLNRLGCQAREGRPKRAGADRSRNVSISPTLSPSRVSTVMP